MRMTLSFYADNGSQVLPEGLFLHRLENHGERGFLYEVVFLDPPSCFEFTRDDKRQLLKTVEDLVYFACERNWRDCTLRDGTLEQREVLIRVFLDSFEKWRRGVVLAFDAFDYIKGDTIYKNEKKLFAEMQEYREIMDADKRKQINDRAIALTQIADELPPSRSLLPLPRSAMPEGAEASVSRESSIQAADVESVIAEITAVLSPIGECLVVYEEKADRMPSLPPKDRYNLLSERRDQEVFKLLNWLKSATPDFIRQLIIVWCSVQERYYELVEHDLEVSKDDFPQGTKRLVAVRNFRDHLRALYEMNMELKVFRALALPGELPVMVYSEMLHDLDPLISGGSGVRFGLLFVSVKQMLKSLEVVCFGRNADRRVIDNEFKMRNIIDNFLLIEQIKSRVLVDMIIQGAVVDGVPFDITYFTGEKLLELNNCLSKPNELNKLPQLLVAIFHRPLINAKDLTVIEAELKATAGQWQADLCIRAKAFESSQLQLSMQLSLLGSREALEPEPGELFGLKAYDVPCAVGDCLFAAIAASDAEGRDGVAIRALAVEQIRRDPQLQGRIMELVGVPEHRLFVNEGDGAFANVEDYLRLMSLPQTWGTEIELVALARTLRRPIVVLTPGNHGDLVFEGVDYDMAHPIFLNYAHGNHYAPLMITEGHEAVEVLAAIRARIEARVIAPVVPAAASAEVSVKQDEKEVKAGVVEKSESEKLEEERRVAEAKAKEAAEKLRLQEERERAEREAAEKAVQEAVKQAAAAKREDYLKLAAKSSDAPPDYYCPITHDVMREPVFDALGYTYERAAIETWFKDHRTDPLTGETLGSVGLITNWALRNLTRSFLENKAQELAAADEAKKAPANDCARFFSSSPRDPDRGGPAAGPINHN